MKNGIYYFSKGGTTKLPKSVEFKNDLRSVFDFYLDILLRLKTKKCLGHLSLRSRQTHPVTYIHACMCACMCRYIYLNVIVVLFVIFMHCIIEISQRAQRGSLLLFFLGISVSEIY